MPNFQSFTQEPPPLVLFPQVVTSTSLGPSGLLMPGPLQSPCLTSAKPTGTGGQLAGSPISGSIVEPGVEPSGSYICVLKFAPVVLFTEGFV